MKVVLDASAVAKLLFPEEGSEKVEEFLSYEVYVPTLLIYEIGNVLWKRVARGEISEDEALEGFSIIRELIKRWIVKEVECLEVSLKCMITCYDASYVTLALMENAKLLTFDKKLKRSLRSCNYSDLLI